MPQNSAVTLGTRGGNNAGKQASGEGPGLPVDPVRLLEQCLGNVSVAQRLLDMLAQELATDLPLLRGFAVCADVRSASSLIHKLGGMAGTIGAHELHRLATDAQCLIRTGAADGARGALADVAAEVARCLAHIDDVRGAVLRVPPGSASPRTGAS